jgi:hypothetical protein
MMVLELEACRVPEDPVFPTPTEGYVVAFVAFYERRFGMPLHQFLLTPSGVLRIVAFCLRLTWVLTLSLICGSTSSMSDVRRTWKQS